jgi:autotransporter-associated beta strand protein
MKTKSPITPSPLLALLGAALLLTFQPLTSTGQVIRTWTGGGADDNWSTTANWTSPNGAPVAGDTNRIVFTGTDRRTNANNITLNSSTTGVAARFNSADWHITGSQVRIPPNFGLTNGVANSVAVWDVPITHTVNGTVFFYLGDVSASLVFPNVIHSTSSARHFRRQHGAGGVGTLSLRNPANTFLGQANLGSGTTEFVKIANIGQPSSLGAYASSANVSIIIGNTGTTFATDVRYIGEEDGETDRIIQFQARPSGYSFNNNSPNNSSLTFNNEWRFTPNTGPCQLTLGGTSTGTNTVNARLYQTVTTLPFGFDVNGPATWVFDGPNELLGPIRFMSGTHYLGAAASIANSPQIVINPGAVLDVSAMLPSGLSIGQFGDQTFLAGRPSSPDTDLVGVLDLGWYSALDLGGIGTPATLKIAGTMRSKSGKGILYFDVSDQPAMAGANDVLEVSGDLDFDFGFTTVNINPYAGALAANTPYTLMKYGGALLGGVGNLNVPPPSRALNAVISTVPGEVRVTFTPSGQSAANLVWTGNGFYWDVNASQSWLNGANPDNFQQLDGVTFNDSASLFDVNVVGVVVPASILVDTEFAYAFKGSGSISGGSGAAITKKGSGELRIETANILAGPILVSAGTLKGANNTALGTGDITLGDVTTGTNDIALLLETASTPNKIIVTDNGTGTVTIGRDSGTGTATFNGEIKVNRDVIMANVDVGAASARRTYFFGEISGDGNLTFSGGGYHTIRRPFPPDSDGNPNFTGDVFIQDEGTILQLDRGNALPPTCNIDVGEGAILYPYNGETIINSLSGTGMVMGVQGSWTLTVGAANGDGVFDGRFVHGRSGNVDGIANFKKVGTGTQILTGDSSTGPEGGSRGGTLVAEGVLAVNNEEGSGLGSGNLTVEAAGTLAGYGSVILTNSNATIQGKLSVGNAGDTAGTNFTLTVEGSGTLTFDGGTLEVDLFSGAGAGDNTANPAAADVLLLANCPVALDAGATLKVNNPNSLTGWAIGDKWKIADWASTPTGTFGTLDLPSPGSGKGWDLSQLYSDGVIAVAAAAVQPMITIELVNATTVKLTWDGGGVLQSAPAVTGTYTDIEGANSGYEAGLGAGPVFYRVRMP